MTQLIEFECRHCQSKIEADYSFAAQETQCPHCSKAIVVPKPQVNLDMKAALRQQYPHLQQKTDDELKNCSLFLDAYLDSFSKSKLDDEMKYQLIASLFEAGLGGSMAKQYEATAFTSKLSGTGSYRKDLSEGLLKNKKFIKKIDQVAIGCGVAIKKKGFLGLFG